MSRQTTGDVPGANARRYKSKEHWVIIDDDQRLGWIYSGIWPADGPTVDPTHTAYRHNGTYLFQDAEDMRNQANANIGLAALDPDAAVRFQRAIDRASAVSSRGFPVMVVITDGYDPLVYHNVSDQTPEREDEPVVGAKLLIEIDGEPHYMTVEEYAEYLADQERHQSYGGVPEA